MAVREEHEEWKISLASRLSRNKRWNIQNKVHKSWAHEHVKSGQVFLSQSLQTWRSENILRVHPKKGTYGNVNLRSKFKKTDSKVRVLLLIYETIKWALNFSVN